MAPQSGRRARARRLTNTLLGAKHGGQHRQGVRIGVDEFASYDTTLRLSYDNISYENMVSGPKSIVRRKLSSTPMRVCLTPSLAPKVLTAMRLTANTKRKS